MASNITDLISENFPPGPGGAGTNGEPAAEALALFSTSASDLPGVLSGLTEAVGELTNTSRAQSSVAWAATRAVLPAAGLEKDGGGSTAASVVAGFLKDGIGAVPLVQGIVRLFGGGGESAEAEPLVKYAPPNPIHLESALWGGVVGQAEYDQEGAVRRLMSPSGGREGARTVDGAVDGNGSALPATQQVVNVTVHAMDSRSFLDHSQDIARAVKEAMLNMNSINDVMSEL